MAGGVKKIEINKQRARTQETLSQFVKQISFLVETGKHNGQATAILGLFKKGSARKIMTAWNFHI